MSLHPNHCMQWEMTVQDFGIGGLRKPIFLRCRTIKGVAVNVHAIRAGANTL